MKTLYHLWQYLDEFLFGVTVSDNSCIENQNTHIFCSTLTLLTWTIWRAPTSASKWRMGFSSAFKGLITLSRITCLLWSNVEKKNRADRLATDNSIIRSMRFACWIIKATDTHSEYLILSWQQWLGECAFVLRYAYIACLVLYMQNVCSLCFPTKSSLLRARGSRKL